MFLPASPVFNRELREIGGGNDEYTKLLLHFDEAPGSAGAFIDNNFGSPRKIPFAAAGGGKIQAGSSLTNGGNILNLNTASAYAAAQNPNVDYDFGAGEFTVDWWEYRAAAPSNTVLIARDTNALFQAFILGYSVDGTQLRNYFSSNGSSWDVIPSTGGYVAMGNAILNAWTHYAVGRYQNTFLAWQNGILKGNVVGSALALQAAPTAPLAIGVWNAIGGILYNSQFFIDELRISKGICRWTANFQPYWFPYDTKPPGVQPVGNGKNDNLTCLLLHCDEGTFKDSAAGSIPPKVGTLSGGMTVDNATKKFGVACLTATAANSRLSFPHHSDFDFGTGEFTIDFWLLRRNLTTGTTYNVMSNRGDVALIGQWILYDNGNGQIVLYASSNGTSWDAANGTYLFPTPLVANTWFHYAVVRSGGVVMGFYNGVQQSGITPFNFNLYNGNRSLDIGSDGNPAGPYSYDEIRISKVARWRQNFYVPGPPTAPY